MWFGTRLAVAKNAAAAILRFVNHSGEHAEDMLTLFASENASITNNQLFYDVNGI